MNKRWDEFRGEQNRAALARLFAALRAAARPEPADSGCIASPHGQ
jgi:hypothetical protein